MCSYQGYEFGAGSYPDSVCIDGQLFDADACDDKGNLYEPMDGYIPCPVCDRQAAINWWAERNESMDWENGETDEQHDAKAKLAATSLVDDIRLNRGIPLTTKDTP